MKLFDYCLLLSWTILSSPSFAGPPAGPASSSDVLSVRNSCARLAVNGAGKVRELADVASGTDWVDHGNGDTLAFVKVGGKALPATAASRHEGLVRLDFEGTAATADLRITSGERYFVIEVAAVDGKDVESLDLINLPLALKATADEPVAACALALNLRTNVQRLPQATGHLQATCYAKLGLAGAKVAILLCPREQLREVMKEVVAGAEELPQTRIGGPWALDNPDNRGSYILECTGNVGEAQIDRWIRMLRELGINQLDFHCGRSFRFGDFTPRAEIFPRGTESVRAMTDKLHAAGMLAGFHTYAFFIAKDSPFVTPVPHPGLAFDASYTLAEPLPADAATVPVVESTAGASAITGFFVRNSATLRIDDELITYKVVRKDPPFAFVECQRGSHGTRPAAHASGAKVRHLKECFGLFVPDPDSTLFGEVISKTARAYNEGGFDMIYLDALDGSDILGGGEWAWHYGSRFVFELAGKLRKPALFEMSTFHHHLWYVRSRMGAWDCPARGPKPFIEMHRIVNRNCRDMFLPPHLGWWAIFSGGGIQPERTTPDVIEYLCCKCIADGCGLSFPVGFTADAYESSPHIQRLGRIVRQYEDLRRSGRVSDEIRRRLGEAGAEFRLQMQPDGRPQFRPVRYDRHKIEWLKPAGNSWSVNNNFGSQPARFRIEALLSVAEYDDPEGVVIEDFAEPATYDTRKVPEGLTADLEKASKPARPGTTGAKFTAAGGKAGAWAMVGRKFSPYLNLLDRGLGLWVYGDGGGEVLNLQVKSPLHAYGGVCDRYAKIDFTGWKYIELIEPEGDDIPNHGWPYMPRPEEWSRIGGLMGYAYPAFHIHVKYDVLENLNLWYGDLPRGGAACYLSPIKSLPLRPCKLSNPAVTIDNRRITFPTQLESGQYLEFRGPDDCTVYGADGNELGKIKPTGDVPLLQPSENHLTFTAEALPGPHPRAAVTVISQGAPL